MTALERFRFGLDIFNDLQAFGRALFEMFRGDSNAARTYLRGEIKRIESQRPGVTADRAAVDDELASLRRERGEKDGAP